MPLQRLYCKPNALLQPLPSRLYRNHWQTHIPSFKEFYSLYIEILSACLVYLQKVSIAHLIVCVFYVELRISLYMHDKNVFVELELQDAESCAF